MSFPKRSLSLGLLLAAIVTLATTRAIMLLVVSDEDGTESNSEGSPTAIVQAPEDAPPTPPREMALVGKDGRIVSPQWDDRHISEAEKAARPITNPRWEPFARCMESHQLVVRAAPGKPFLQTDLDRLVERLNQRGPLVTMGDDGQWVVRQDEQSKAFTDCAFSALYITSDDLHKILTPDELKRAQTNGDAPLDSPPAEATVG